MRHPSDATLLAGMEIRYVTIIESYSWRRFVCKAVMLVTRMLHAVRAAEELRA